MKPIRFPMKYQDGLATAIVIGYRDAVFILEVTRIGGSIQYLNVTQEWIEKEMWRYPVAEISDYGKENNIS